LRTGQAAHFDAAWMAEGDKIRSKMSDFKRNIDRILEFGGTPGQQSLWKEHYNYAEYLAIKSTQEAYMPNSQRKKQYLRIYADAAKKNETLVRYLVRLSNSMTTAELLNASYTRPSPNAVAAAEALARWRDAGWSLSGHTSDMIEQ